MNSRRSFISRLGIGASCALASAAGMAKADLPKADGAAQRVAALEAEKALRQLHKGFERAMDNGMHDEIIGMFAADAEVVFNGGVFRGTRGVSRLFREHFPSGKTGASLSQAPGFELAADQLHDSVTVAADLKSATAVFPYSIQVGAPIETESSLAAMARLHGEGVRTWWEGGVYRVAYCKDAAGSWRISRLEYDTLSRADWRSGRSYAQPIAASRFAARFPQDQQGPDALV
jgi:hypothetical protein